MKDLMKEHRIGRVNEVVLPWKHHITVVSSGQSVYKNNITHKEGSVINKEYVWTRKPYNTCKHHDTLINMIM